MQGRRSSIALKLLPSFADFAFLLPLVFLFARMNGLVTLLGDCDTGWHIRTGEWILANRAVPAQDLFSYSKAGAPWFAWEWLSDVLFAWLNAVGGLRAVALLGILMLAAVTALAYRLARRKANVMVAIAVTVVAVAASSIHWLARPHLFTMLFVLLFYAALERVREGRGHVAGIPCLAILPVATVLWTNLHGGFAAGIVMVACYGAGELLYMVFSAGQAERAARRATALRYFFCALACFAASFVNPYAYRLHLHIVRYFQDPFAARHISEFLSPDFHHPTAIFFEALLALAAAAACWCISRRRFIEPLLLAVWAHGALLANRNIAIFAMLGTPVLAAVVQEWVDRLPEWNLPGWLSRMAARFNRLAARTAETEAAARWHTVPVAVMLLVVAVIWSPHPPKKFRAEFDPERFPVKAVAALRLDTSNRIFTHDQWGDYLIWTLYPQHKVFLDGRSDFYGNEFEEQCFDVLYVKPGWEKILARFGVDTILLSPNVSLAGALKESSRWRLVYDDGVALVFRPAENIGGSPISVAATGGGASRDREITKTQLRDQAITVIKTKT